MLHTLKHKVCVIIIPPSLCRCVRGFVAKLDRATSLRGTQCELRASFGEQALICSHFSLILIFPEDFGCHAVRGLASTLSCREFQTLEHFHDGGRGAGFLCWTFSRTSMGVAMCHVLAGRLSPVRPSAWWSASQVLSVFGSAQAVARANGRSAFHLSRLGLTGPGHSVPAFYLLPLGIP